MNNMFILITILLCTGCVSNGNISHDTSVVDRHAVENTNKIFVGVPILMSLEGSSARLNDEWVVTAGHNENILRMQLREFYKHSLCDIAMYRLEGDNTSGVSSVPQNNTIFHIGYPFAQTIAVNEGVYFSDMFDGDCLYSLSTGSIMSGMSGGGVYDSQGNLVGVNVGISGPVEMPDGRVLDKQTVWLRLGVVWDWIESVLIKNKE